MFAGDTRLGGTISVLRGRAATQSYLKRLEDQACRDLTGFKGKCKAPHLGGKSSL